MKCSDQGRQEVGEVLSGLGGTSVSKSCPSFLFVIIFYPHPRIWLLIWEGGRKGGRSIGCLPRATRLGTESGCVP